MEPVGVWRSGPVLQHVLKRRKLLAAMVEHGVKHDADAPFVAAFDDLFQQRIVAEVRVDLL